MDAEEFAKWKTKKLIQIQREIEREENAKARKRAEQELQKFLAEIRAEEEAKRRAWGKHEAVKKQGRKTILGGGGGPNFFKAAG